MEQYGNQTTYNMEPVLLSNIKSCQYWAASAMQLDTVEEIVDEIYNTVTDVEPWMSGNARGPSTAFNLLYRLCQIKPTAKEVRIMLDHRDSPYIRAEFSPSPEDLGEVITMGDFVRDIMLDQFYFETLFPRVPKPVLDEIQAKLKDLELPTAVRGNGGQGGEDRRGFDDASGKRPASVKASLSVAMGQRAPNRAGVREQGRGLGAEIQLERQQQQQQRRRSPSRDGGRGDERREELGPSRDSRRDDKDRRYDDRGGRDKDYRRDNRDRDYRREERDRRERDRGYERRDRSRNRDRERRRDDCDRRDRDHRRDRSRSRERARSGSRDARDVFRERAVGAAPADQVKERYQ
eukprot:scaffold22.g6116.t1